MTAGYTRYTNSSKDPITYRAVLSILTNLDQSRLGDPQPLETRLEFEPSTYKICYWQPKKCSTLKASRTFYGCKSKKIWVRRSQVQNLVPVRTLRCGISDKMCPSSCDLYAQYHFMCEMYWLTVHLLSMREM